jgi:hypothetical protein
MPTKRVCVADISGFAQTYAQPQTYAQQRGGQGLAPKPGDLRWPNIAVLTPPECLEKLK